MLVSYNEKGEAIYDLTRVETEELNQTGYIYDDEKELAVIQVANNQYVVAKATKNWKELNFSH